MVRCFRISRTRSRPRISHAITVSARPVRTFSMRPARSPKATLHIPRQDLTIFALMTALSDAGRSLNRRALHSPERYVQARRLGY